MYSYSNKYTNSILDLGYIFKNTLVGHVPLCPARGFRPIQCLFSSIKQRLGQWFPTFVHHDTFFDIT